MRIFVLIVAAIAILGLSAINIPAPARSGTGLDVPRDVTLKKSTQSSFRVDNFNIQRSKGKDGVRDLSRAIDVLKGSDIAGLQETSGTLFYGWKPQAEQVAESIGAGFLFAPTSWKWFQPYRGPALLSRFPVESWSTMHLPTAEDASDHRLLISAIIMINEQPVRILVTHLTRREYSDEQLAYVLDMFRESPLPTILMADLNVDLNNERLKPFLEDPTVTDAVEEAIGAFWRLDWILTKGFDVVGGGVTPRGISDHAHYWVELVLKSDGRE